MTRLPSASCWIQSGVPRPRRLSRVTLASAAAWYLRRLLPGCSPSAPSGRSWSTYSSVPSGAADPASAAARTAARDAPQRSARSVLSPWAASTSRPLLPTADWSLSVENERSSAHRARSHHRVRRSTRRFCCRVLTAPTSANVAAMRIATAGLIRVARSWSDRIDDTGRVPVVHNGDPEVAQGGGVRSGVPHARRSLGHLDG